MENNKDIFGEFQQSLRGLGGKLHVLETSVSVERQMEYFKYSENVREHSKEETIDEQIEVLHSEDATFDEMKYAMTFLAISGDVKAYRALETYNKESSKDKLLTEWAAMSLLQAKITLESEFSDEKQVFISTGLGGKGSKLRFYAFFKSTDLKPFSDYQRDLIEKEIPFYIQKFHGKLEEIKVESNYFSLLFLIGLQVDIKNMLQGAIAECNEYGNFIGGNFIVTNVKVFGPEEIQKELRKK
jgi:hypothetical protein